MNYLTDEDNSSLRSQDDEINQIKSIMVMFIFPLLID